MAYPSFPLNVWLVENNNPFAAAPGGAAEVAQFRSGVVALLKQWYAKVIQNAAAPAPPSGWKAAIDVNWSDMKNVAVGDRDVVLYFSPLVPGDGKTTSGACGPGRTRTPSAACPLRPLTTSRSSICSRPGSPPPWAG